MSVRQVKSFIIDLLYWYLGKLRVFKTYFLHVPRYLKPIPNKIEGEILIIVPHADDELIGCHQFIRHNINNATLFYCGFTGKNKTQENHIVRLDEFKKYCEQSNCKYVVSSENVKEDLYSYLDEAKPDIVAIPSMVDWHSEHRVINYYIRDYINSHRNPCIKSVLWYHLSVPLYAGNANYAWIQHMIHHLAPNGKIGLVLANGALSSQTGGEGDIRQKIIEADLVEGIIAMPTQLFYSVTIPVTLWFISKNKPQKGKTLFIDARKMGHMVDRKHRDFSDEDIRKLSDTFEAFQNGTLTDKKGFCAVATTADIAKQDYILTPGRYVGIADQEEDSEPFEKKCRV